MIKSKGLHTFQNYLSQIPEGSQFIANNVVIDRDGVMEPRRGIKVLGEIPDVSKQLLTYKDRILVHYDDVIAYSDNNDPASFTPFQGTFTFEPSAVDPLLNTIRINQHGLKDGNALVFTSTGILPAPLISGTTYYVTSATENTFQLSVNPSGNPLLDITTAGTGIHTVTFEFVFTELDPGLRIKSIEQNSSLYVTTQTGIKKISQLSPLSVSSAGGVKALDLQLNVDLSAALGFLPDSKEVAYRVVWGTKDVNNTLILGAPSYRSTVQNRTGSPRNVLISFAVPSGITTSYFYQVYRTAVADIDGSGDEMKLVFEAPYQMGDTISITDQQPEDLQRSGTPLYTNEFSGEGISQANDRPPVSKDIALYKNIAFYANTRTPHRFDLTLLGIDGLVELGVASISATNPAVITTTTPHNLISGKEIVLVGSGNINGTAGLDGKYVATVTGTNTFTIMANGALQGVTTPDVRNVYTSNIKISKGTIENTYYFVGRAEKYQVTVGAVGAAINGDYFYINSFDNTIQYYVLYDDGTAVDPMIPNKALIRVVYDSAMDTPAEVAEKTRLALENSGDFVGATVMNVLTIDGANSGPADNILNVTLPGSWTFTTLQNGFGEIANLNYVRRSTYVSAALAVEDTAKSLARVINRNSDDVVSAYYASDSDELPGTLLFENKALDTTAFSVLADSATTGAVFNPELTTAQFSQNEVALNKLYFSKKDQPEAVPLTNSVNVGPKDKPILRIIGLRDSLFILKEEGIYRLTGEDFTNFTVSLFDNSANITAPDSAVVLNNQIYCLTTQGVATLSETGTGVISRPIEDVFTKVGAPAFTNSSQIIFGVGYEADRSYIIFLPSSVDDTYATKAFRYSTFTQAWTSWTSRSNCGIIQPVKNLLHLGAGDINAVEIERKNLTSRDYADRQYLRQISILNSGFVYVDSSAGFNKGDMLVQTQYLTASFYNRTVNKLKLDGSLNFPEMFPEITVPGTNLSLIFEDLVEQLNISDLTLQSRTLSLPLDVDILTDTFTFMGHGFVNGDAVIVTGGSLPTPLMSGEYYFVVGATTNTFQLSSSLGGTAINLTTTGSGAMVVDERYLFTGSADFAQIQAEFNFNIRKLNQSAGAAFSNYAESIGTVDLDVVIEQPFRQSNKFTTSNIPLIFTGSAMHYEAISSNIVWAFLSLGDPSISKHVREGTFIIENYTLTGATVGYATDLSGDFEDILFPIQGTGVYGNSNYDSVVWGGEGIAWPLRTLIPRQKQRCRYIKARFMHSNAFNKYSLLGISYTFEIVSERAWR